MGNSNSGQAAIVRTLSQVRDRAENHVGRLTVAGRYHCEKRLEDDYQVSEEVLGKGFNGEVVVAKQIISGAKVAVKPFQLRGADEEKLKELSTELEIFLNMDHPHVARLVDIYESGDCLHLVMECMEGGEVFQRVLAKKKFTSAAASVAVRQMLLALNYIHQQNIAHRDVKLENFLYESKEGDHLKLIDFGFSKHWDKNSKMELSCGTLTYVAPEVLKKSYTTQCDMWSLGITAFILLAGYMPFAGSEDKIIRNIRAGQYNWKDDVWAKVPEDAQDFVKKTLVVNPDKRLTAMQGLEHPWIKKHFEDPTAGHEIMHDDETVESISKYMNATRFQKAIFQSMAWSLTAAERKELRDIFLAIDKDNSGTIQLNELKDALAHHPNFCGGEVKPIFEALDSSHSHEIHYSDFLAAMCSSKVELSQDLIKQTFRRFDADGAGFITIDDLKVVIGDSLDGASAESILKVVDTSGDGKIDYGEFAAYLRSDKVTDDHLESVSKVIESASGKASPAAPKRKDAQKQETSCCPCGAACTVQ